MGSFQNLVRGSFGESPSYRNGNKSNHHNNDRIRVYNNSTNNSL